MTTLEAIILGFIQGLTEFLPISSSGHLELGQLFLGLTDLQQYVFFNLICHLGTLTAIVLSFSTQIKSILITDKTQLKQLFLATLPLFPLVLIMKPLKALFDQPQYLGYCFLFTAFLLYLGIRLGTTVSDAARQKHRWRDAVIIGMFQAVAVLPGVSRSGATISAGRLLGWKQEDSMTFAFLLAIPTILGGITLETLHLIKEPAAPSISAMQYFAGFLSSFVFGYITLQILMRLASKTNFIYFVWYCICIGILSLLYFS